MPKVILLRPRQDETGSKVPHTHTSEKIHPYPSGMTVCYSETVDDSSSSKIKQLEDELIKILDQYGLNTPTHRTICSDSSDEQIEDDYKTALANLSHLEEIVVFSPEIQRQELAGPSEEEGKTATASWGDVFVKMGEEYPFLFTVYTKSYSRSQRLRYGEQIAPSSRDILLDKKQLDRLDILRAVIKWVNLYFPSLKGRPISLESDSVLQTLVCDPLVEIRCPDSLF